jgi:hypothetical protein
MSSFIPSPFLRQVLIADAVTSAASGVLMFAGSGFLAGILGLPASLLSYAGLSLLPFAALVGLAASRPSLPRVAVWAIIACNAVWALDSIAILFTGWTAPNTLGQVFIVAQALVVLLLAELEYMGMRRSTALAT